MQLGETLIEDTFAEAFRMRYARLIVTAHDEHWLNAALQEATGFATSIIGCDTEAGVERRLSADETPDGRLGAAMLLFGFSSDALTKVVTARTGQSLMTAPTTAVYDGLPDAEERIPLGKHLRFFGDGLQRSKKIGDRRYWRVPVMDGEFLVQDSVGVAKGIGGGNLILEAASLDAGLAAARRAIEAIDRAPGVITPFPGGVVRSGSKVGSQYKKLSASTNDPYCPTLRGRVATRLHEGVKTALEIVIDGFDEPHIARAMADGMRAAAGPGLLAISAGNYGGNLGKFHFHLRQLLAPA